MKKPTIEELQYSKIPEKELEKWNQDFTKKEWKIISQHQKLGEFFIAKHKNKVNWTMISKYQELSESFVNQFMSRFKSEDSRDNIIWNVSLSTDFIDRWSHKFSSFWIIEWIAEKQKGVLSESFMRKYKEDLNWEDVAEFQYFSLSFAVEMIDCLYPYCFKIKRNKYIKKEEKKKIIDTLKVVHKLTK